MDATTMIVVTVALNCTHAGQLCRVFTEPGVSRGVPALSSAVPTTPVVAEAKRTTNALRAPAARAR